MTEGPSPVIPLVLFGILGLLFHARSLKNGGSSDSDGEETSFNSVLVISLVVVLLVQYLSTSIVLPLILILLTIAVSNVPLGPLVLILIIYFASVYLPSSFQAFHVKEDEAAADHESDGAGHGLGSILLLVIFLTLCAFFQKGEGSAWGPPLLAVLLFILYNFFH